MGIHSITQKSVKVHSDVTGTRVKYVQTHTPVSRKKDCSDIEKCEDFDDLYACGLAQAQRTGTMQAFTERFNVEICCDGQEQALISALREYLRPQQAPQSLVERIKHNLDRLCH